MPLRVPEQRFAGRYIGTCIGSIPLGRDLTCGTQGLWIPGCCGQASVSQACRQLQRVWRTRWQAQEGGPQGKHMYCTARSCTERFTRRWAGGSNLPPKKHGEILEKNLSPEQVACSIFPSPPAGLLPIPSPPPASLPILHPALHTFHHIPSTYPTPNTLTFILPLGTAVAEQSKLLPVTRYRARV